VRRHFGDLVFDAVVPRNVRLAEAPSHGLPITAYDPHSAGADAYYRVAGELVERMRRPAPSTSLAGVHAGA
jgi:chromosome partitioning protein